VVHIDSFAGRDNLILLETSPYKTEILNILGTNIAQMTGTCRNNYVTEAP